MFSIAGLLGIIFDVLYDEDVISEEAFYDWKKSDNPQESTGKGVALKSVTSFFTWLTEADWLLGQRWTWEQLDVWTLKRSELETMKFQVFSQFW